MPLNVPNRIAALLYEHNDEVTKSARYVKTWPIGEPSEPATPEQQEEFYKRHGDGDAKLGENRISEEDKRQPAHLGRVPSSKTKESDPKREGERRSRKHLIYD